MDMMIYTCVHGNIARDCDECYDDNRALSEVKDFGTWIPAVTKCSKHPQIPLTEHYDCQFCLYKGDLFDAKKKQ